MLLGAALLLILAGCTVIAGGTTPPSLTTTTVMTSQYTSVTSTSTSTTASRKDVTVADAHALIEANKGNPDFVILDVRTPAEYAAGHIEGAVNIDYEAADFRDQVSNLDKVKTYLVYCRTGVRSAAASDIMVGLGFKDVTSMLGGITEWQSAGYSVVQ